MSRSLPALLLVAVLALAGCERDAASGPSAPADRAGVEADAGGGAEFDAAIEDFERTWLGVLPCADCDGIQTRLHLERDGDAQTYELEETYLGADGEAVFTQAGTWTQEEADGVSFRLDPEAPGGRRYALRADGSLDLLDGRGVPLEPAGHYRLQRL